MNALYVTYNKFPEGDAGSIRNYIIGKIFSEIGFNVKIIGMGETIASGKSSYKEFEYYSLRKNTNSTFSKILNLLEYKKNLSDLIENTIKIYNLDVIIFDDLPINAMFYLKKISKKNKIKLIHNSVEWYSPEQFKFGKFSYNYLIKNFLNKYFITKGVGVISISSYLNDYFLSKQIPSVRIPFILDCLHNQVDKNISEEKIRITYAGSPGRKDYLKEFIQALSQLSSFEKEKIIFTVIGVTKEQLISNCEVQKELVELCDGSIECLGRIQRKKVIEILKNTDFTILFRNQNLRYAKAGFPTKVVESLSEATPVLLNLTSDLDRYMINNYNSFIVKSLNPDDIKNRLLEIIKLSQDERKKMFNNSLLTAQKNFDYRLYIPKINKLLKEINI